MAPIRIGFLGLSKVGWAKGAHFPYLERSDKYQIVAICNSSVESSREAIRAYKLPESTRAYGDAEELAKDQDIDLVVCSVRVDRHFPTISPSLRAGKNVYVEWPLGKNLAEAEELAVLAKKHGVKVAEVGLQGRQSPFVKKIREVVKSGRIGDVLSSTWVAHGGNGGETASEKLEYLGRREVGGNMMTIHFGHTIDYIQYVLGYGFETPPKTLLANRRPYQKLLDGDGKVIEERHPKTADDTIFLNGTLSTGIPLSYSLRGGKGFPNAPGLVWSIYGSKGEIRITASGLFIQVGYPDQKIEVVVGEEVEEISVEKDGLEDLAAGANVGRVYEAIAKGAVGCSFEDAVERHRLIDRMYKENGIVF